MTVPPSVSQTVASPVQDDKKYDIHHRDLIALKVS